MPLISSKGGDLASKSIVLSIRGMRGLLPPSDCVYHLIPGEEVSLFSLSIGRFNDRPRRRMSAHRSPTFLTRSGILRSVNVRGSTSPRSISFHVHGAET